MVEMYFARTNPIGIRKVEVIRATELSVYVDHPNIPSGRQVHRNTTKSYWADSFDEAQEWLRHKAQDKIDILVEELSRRREDLVKIMMLKEE